MNDFFSLFGAIGSGPAPDLIPKTELENGVKISTVDSYDMGPETALIGADHEVVPVERYGCETEAKKGHEKWVKLAKEATYPLEVEKLEYGDLLGSEKVKIHNKDSMK